MAVLGFVTVQQVPFPVRRQRRTLEPDGIALFSLKTDADASGGNVLVTVRSDTNEFFYILKALSLGVNNAATQPGPAVVLFTPAWLSDLEVFPDAINFELLVNLAESTTGVWRPQGQDIAAGIMAGQTVPLGKVRPLAIATQDLMLFNFVDNINNADYLTKGLFYAYRKEALTVPGFLDQLVRPALIR